mgnify:CR=1 FL=1
MKTAIIHDWIPVIAGAEKVLEQILKLYPDADVFTLFDFASKDTPQIFENYSHYARKRSRILISRITI